MSDKHEDIIYRQFARIYPHECYADDPERFWELFHKLNPDVPRSAMEAALKATREEKP